MTLALDSELRISMAALRYSVAELAAVVEETAQLDPELAEGPKVSLAVFLSCYSRPPIGTVRLLLSQPYRRQLQPCLVEDFIGADSAVQLKYIVRRRLVQRTSLGGSFSKGFALKRSI